MILKHGTILMQSENIWFLLVANIIATVNTSVDYTYTHFLKSFNEV